MTKVRLPGRQLTGIFRMAGRQLSLPCKRSQEEKSAAFVDVCFIFMATGFLPTVGNCFMAEYYTSPVRWMFTNIKDIRR